MLSVIIIGGGAGSIRGEDRLFFELEDSGGRGTVTGTIMNVTGKKIVFRTGTGATREFSTSEVLELETSQSDAQRDGKKLLHEGKTAEAMTAFTTALEQEQRSWMRREILADMIRCAMRLGNYAQAGTRFLLLLQSDPETSHFDLIPLQWSPFDRNPAWVNEAERWIEMSQPAAQLMGASVLLEESVSAANAERVLEKLDTHPDRRVAYLARMQLWRLRIKSGDITASQPLRWQSSIDELPEELRYGGYFLLGQAYLQRGARSSAVAAFLWLPMTDAPDHRLSARALLEAAETLGSIGQADEASHLYQELLKRYNDTTMAQDARQMLDELTSETN
ncbi:MAG: tetratricopeptide repeat protein [Planctomycetaceae bacterium]